MHCPSIQRTANSTRVASLLLFLSSKLLSYPLVTTHPPQECSRALHLYRINLYLHGHYRRGQSASEILPSHNNSNTTVTAVAKPILVLVETCVQALSRK